MYLTEKRDGTIKEGKISPEALVQRSGEVIGRIGAGPVFPDPDPSLLRVKEFNVFSALVYALEKTIELTQLIFISIGKLLVGALGLENLTGPVTIAEIAGKTMQVGVSSFLNFLAYLSISLGVFNILPIPVLDGGHILYAVIEFLKGKPLSEKTQQRGLAVGIAILASLMTLAFYNDLVRLLF